MTPRLSDEKLKELELSQPSLYYGKREINVTIYREMILSGAIQIVKQYKNKYKGVYLGMYVIADMEVFDRKYKEHIDRCDANMKEQDPNYVPTLYVEQFIR